MNVSLAPSTATSLPGAQIEREALLRTYRHMVMAREIDALEERFAARGETWFQVSGGGHETVATLAPHLGPQDWLHCHYRDKALMLARGMTADMFFLALFCKDASHSRGRQMSAHMSWREGKVLSLCGPVGNNALQAVGIAMQCKSHADAPIVLCAVGDGTAQQGEVLEAIGAAARDALPVLFLVEDNQFAISSPTRGRTFYSLPDGPADYFHGVPIDHLDGRHPSECYRAFGQTVARMRHDRRPRIVVMSVERLCDHTNADDQSRYRDLADIVRAQAHADPIANLETELCAGGVDPLAITAARSQIRTEASAAAERARHTSDASTPSLAALPSTSEPEEYRGTAQARSHTLLMALRATLEAHLHADPRVCLYGEDIEDPKGDVFGVTSGLSTAFPDRVRNSPLSESTIIGTAIGRALAGARPVAFLQFADFLPLAFNQIAAELGSMHWRTDGAWQCPVIIMVPCGGYRPGLGPFHAQSLESIVAHMPGIQVVMPSNAADAAGLLNAAFASTTPTVFFYPKACLNDRTQTTSADLARHYVGFGRARVERAGTDLTLVSYGNGMARCREAAQIMARAGCEMELIDLRSLAPWDSETVIRSVARTRRLVIVHEDNRTCGMGAEIAATVGEKLDGEFAVRRVVRDDAYIPCNFEAQLALLPSTRGILEAVTQLTGFDLAWSEPTPRVPDEWVVSALGSGPSDESVTIIELPVTPGQEVVAGQIVASVEASKSNVDIEASSSGRVLRVCAQAGDQVAVGTPLIVLQGATLAAAASLPDDAVRAIVTRRPAPAALRVQTDPQFASLVGLTLPVAVPGSLNLTNAAMAPAFAGRTAEDIECLTGIQSRHRAAPGEDALSLGTLAAQRALAEHGLRVADLDMLICATVTPPTASPSVACRILLALGNAEVPAFDLNAACSGYLYALQVAHDFLKFKPRGRVLVVTADVLSPLLDPADFSTCAVFADGATATVVMGEAHRQDFRFELRRPNLSASGEAGDALRVPAVGSPGHIFMDGQKVFSEAVRRMGSALSRICADHGITPQGLDWIVPHQANQRILTALARRLSIDNSKVLSNLAQTGNTSASSIPLCLRELSDRVLPGQTLGLVAFGAGYTYGAAIMDAVHPGPDAHARVH